MKCPFCIKVCGKCGRLLVANNDNFSKNKNGKYGYHSKCKECSKKYSKKYYQDNREEICEEHRQYHESHKDKINEKKKKYRQDNKEDINERNRKYYQDNKDLINKKHKQYYQDNKDAIKEYRKEYDKKYYEENKDKILTRCKEYKENNPEVVFNQNNKRRSLEENQGKGITKEQWREMMMFFDFKCAYSGEELSKETRTIDHVIALSKNGDNEVWNLVPMLKNHNSSKLNKDMLEWYQEQSFYSEERLAKIYEWIEYAKNKYQK